MTIQEIVTQGEGQSLGPITIKRIWPVQGSGARANRFMLIQDATGENALKIWGPAGNSPLLQEGAVIHLQAQGPQSGLKPDEYNGRKYISANGCQVTAAEGGAAPSGGSSGGRQASNVGGGSARDSGTLVKMTDEETAARIGHFTKLVYDACQQEQLPEEVCVGAAINAGQNGALWWFGQKYPGMAAEEG